MWLQMYECVTNTLSIELNTAMYAKCDIRTLSTNLLSWTDAKIRRWRKKKNSENRQKADRCKALFKYSATSRNSRHTHLHTYTPYIYTYKSSRTTRMEWMREWVSEKFIKEKIISYINYIKYLHLAKCIFSRFRLRSTIII